jgi:O-antigen ligase
MMPFLDQIAMAVALLLGSGALHALVAIVLSEAVVESLQPVFTGTWLSLYIWAGGKLLLWHGLGWVQWLVIRRPALLVVLTIAACSVLWSIHPALTAQRSIHLIGTTLFAVYVGYHLSTKSVIGVLTFVFALLVIGGAFVALAVPEVGLHDYEGKLVWRGLQQEKNTFGLTSATAFLFFFVRSMSVNRAHPWLDWAICAVSVVTLVMSDSMTSMGALLVGLTVASCFLIGSGGRMTTLVPLFGVGGGLCVLLLVLLFTTGTGELFELFGRSSDITGRTVIWSGVSNLIDKHALLGLGYGGIWFPRPQEGWLQMSLLGTHWVAFHAHNALLQVASELGLIATVAAIILLVQSFYEAIRSFLRTHQPFALFLIAFNAAFILVNVFESLLFSDRSPAWVLFIALPIALLKSSPAAASRPNSAGHDWDHAKPLDPKDSGMAQT